MRGNKGLLALALVAVSAAVVLAGINVAGAVTGAPTPTTVGGIKPDAPAVSGTRVVWSDYQQGQWDVWMYDAATREVRQLTSGAGDKLSPAIDGDSVVYVQYVNGKDADLYLYDIPSQTSRPLVVTSGDQLNPTISGHWVAWEENSSSTSGMSVVKALDITTPGATPITVDSATYSLSSAYGGSMHRPKLSGDVLVYEFQHSGRGDSDVRMYSMSTATKTDVAASAADERQPVTDGTWVVWTQADDDTGYDIWAENITDPAPQPVVVAAGEGEQSMPVVGNGVASWTDNGSGAPVVMSKNLTTGATAAFPYRGSAAVAGFSAQGDATTWLQQAGSRWQVRALFGSPVRSVSSLTSLAMSLDVVPTFSNFRFALLSSAGDVTLPAVSSASVTPGQRSVSRTAPLRVRFSKSMNAGTINANTVHLIDSRTKKPVAAAVSYSWLTRSAVITPTRPLAAGSYALSVSPTVADTSGNLLSTSMGLAFSTSSAQALGYFPPSQVQNPTAQIVDANADVKLLWSPASDDVGVTGYIVKRSMSAITTEAQWTAAETVTSITATGATVAPSVALNEKAKKSAVYYAVRATDGDSMLSASWYNFSPVPHGMYVLGGNTNTCITCHTIHGAPTNSGLGVLGARGAQGCYVCHGSTSQAAAYGAGSVNNIQADFFDYPSMVASWTPTMGATPSRHGNAFIRAQTDNQQCDMCHSPHKKPYDDNPALSYSQLLKRPTSATATALYSLDSSPAANFNETFCFTCHGASVGTTSPPAAPYAYMAQMGGATAYDNTAGDHGQANWWAASTAHGSANMTDTARVNPAPNGTTLPKNNCEVCHDKHGSNSPSLLAYRRGANNSGLADSGVLCFKCHSASASAPDTGWAGGRTYNAWNGRDVQAEFARTGSKHPITAGVGGGPQPGTHTDSTDADFATYSLSNTAVRGSGVSAYINLADATGGYQPAGYFTSSVIVPTPNLSSWTDLVINGAAAANTSMTVTVYDGTDGGMVTPLVGPIPWAAGTTNVDIPLSTIDKNAHPTLFARVNLQGNAPAPRSFADTFSSGVWNGTWTDNLLGGSADPDAGSTTSLYNLTYTGLSGSVIDATVGMTTADAGWTLNTGNGSDGATPNYARTATSGSTDTTMTKNLGDLSAYTSWGVSYYYRNGGTLAVGDYLIVEYSTNGGASWATLRTHNSTTNNPGTTWTQFGPDTGLPVGTDVRLRFRSKIAAPASNNNRVDTIAITRTSAPGNAWPSEASNAITLRADGSDFNGTADQGEFLALKPSAAGSWVSTADADAVVDVNSIATVSPATLSAGAKAGLDVRVHASDPATAGAMSAAIFVTPSNGVIFQYRTATGGATTLVTTAGQAPPKKLRLSRRGNSFSGYYWNGSAWVQVGSTQTITVGANSLSWGLAASSVNAGNFTDSTFDNFSITEASIVSAVTPQVNDLTVNYTFTPPPGGGTATCYSCHNTHFVGKGGATANDMTRASNPTDTGAPFAGTETQFCLGCHGGTNNSYYNYNSATGAITITPITNASQLIPYAISMRSFGSSWPYFTGWYKGATGNAPGFTSSGHATSTSVGKADCGTCHDPHASNHDSLLAWTTPSGWTTAPAGITGRARDNTDTASANSYLCLNCHGNASTGLTAYKGATAPGTASVRMDIGTVLAGTYGHGTSLQADAVHRDTETAANLGAGSRHAECADCHDPHQAQAGVHTATSSQAGKVLIGAYGVKPTWSATIMSAPTAFAVTRLGSASTDYEAYLCLKCHSSYVNLTGVTAKGPGATTLQETDLATEFNPSNLSGHNVMGAVFARQISETQGGHTYTWFAPTTSSLSLGNGWTNSSSMTCSDCHTNNGAGARGPHGSSLPYGLRWGPTSAEWYTASLGDSWTSSSTSTNFCAGCHTSDPHGNWESQGWGGGHNVACDQCHIRIPHGWKRPRMLGYHGTDSAPYVVGNSGLEGVAFTGNITTNDTLSNSGDCYSTCNHHNDPGGSAVW